MAFKKPHHVAETNKVTPTGDGLEIKPRGLNIVWGKDGRYWNIPPNDDPAELIQVSWLEVSGSVKVQRGQKYKVTFEVSLTPDSFGWNGSPVLVMAKVGKKGKYSFKEVNLTENNFSTPKIIPSPEDLEINVESADSEPELYFGLYEVWSGKWKGGLKIHKAILKKV